jgi:hypothetical protein
MVDTLYPTLPSNSGENVEPPETKPNLETDTDEGGNDEDNAGNANVECEVENKDLKNERYEEVIRIYTCAPEDYYGILNLPQNCGQSDIKKQKNKMLKLVHEDKNPDSSAKDASQSKYSNSKSC